MFRDNRIKTSVHVYVNVRHEYRALNDDIV